MRSLFRTIHRGDLRDALALAAAVGVVGASFGALATAAGVPPAIAVAMSVLVLRGRVAVPGRSRWSRRGQRGGRRWSAALLLNARHLPFGLGDGRRSSATGGRPGCSGAHPHRRGPWRSRGRAARARPRAGGVLDVRRAAVRRSGTSAPSSGVLAGAAVPDPAAFGVDAAFPAALLALLLPGLRPADARPASGSPRRPWRCWPRRCCRPGCRCWPGCWGCWRQGAGSAGRRDELAGRAGSRRRAPTRCGSPGSCCAARVCDARTGDRASSTSAPRRCSWRWSRRPR